VVLVREEAGPVERLRPLAQAVAALPNAVLVGAVSRPPGVLVAAADDSGVEANRLLKSALEPVGGRGGGTARLAQGTVADGAVVERVVAALDAAL
jgi:alanyl-tRNA synthetase